MAKAVTLKNNNNEEVYPVTDISLVNGELNGARIVNASVGSDKLTPNAVWTENIKDGAVTSNKIDWKTLGYKHASAPTDVPVGTSNTVLVTLKLTAGTWLLIGTSDFTHRNTAIGDSFISFQNLETHAEIGNGFYFNEINDGTYWSIETIHGVVTLTSTYNIGFVARKGMGDLTARRRSFTAIRIG